MLILVPIFGLMCLCFVRDAVVSNSDVFANINIAVPVPYIFNVPLKPLASFGQFFNVSECDEWYMFQFDNSTADKDKQFFGSNNGHPMLFPQSSGMLKGGKGILEMPCQQVQRSVPYFKELEREDGTPNQVVFDKVQVLSEKNVSLTLKHLTIDGLEEVPDGILNIKESNEKAFVYKL